MLKDSKEFDDVRWLNFCSALLEITNDCRATMHEPDEQDISAVVLGYKLDNAFGDVPWNNQGEMTIGITAEHSPEDGEPATEWFNLASLIALARIGAETLLTGD